MEGGRVTAKSMQSSEPSHREGEDDEEARKESVEEKERRRGRKGRESEAELLETAQKGLARRAVEIARDMHIQYWRDRNATADLILLGIPPGS